MLNINKIGKMLIYNNNIKYFKIWVAIQANKT